MPAIADMLSDRSRQRLLERIAEYEALDHLLREPGQQRPPDPPPTLTSIAATTAREDLPPHAHA